jgi:hypothetical protein
MKKISYRYRLRKFFVWLRRVWDFATLNRKSKVSLSEDVDLAVKIVMRLISSGADVRHSALQGYFHINKDHVYAKLSTHSITIINGVYAYEILIPAEEGFELMTRIRALNERRLLKTELGHKARIAKSLRSIYEKLEDEQRDTGGSENL